MNTDRPSWSRRSLLGRAIAFAILVAVPPASAQATAASPSYGSGFSSAGLTLNGNAAINGTRLRLTDGGRSEAGSAFFNTLVNVQSFTNDFSFQLTNATADGFTFTIQGNSPTALGMGGGNLGYSSSIAKSVAVKFDSYSNAGEGNDSTGSYTNGASPTLPSVDMTHSGIDLHSGDVMSVHMTYNGTTLAVQISDATKSTSFRTSFPVNIPNMVGGSTAYVGFTGATGGLTAVQDILSWTYVPSGSGNPQPLQITTSSLPVGAVGVSYKAALAAANGVPSYTWSLTGGRLPAGLGLQASSGEILGTPTQAGAFSFSVQVKDSSGQTASGGFSANIVPASAPIVSSISPKSGPTTGGTLVTVSGSNFEAGATAAFGGVSSLSVTVNSRTQIQAVAPAHIAGTIDVTVRNNDSQSSTLGSSFAYSLVTPTVSSVSPNSGSTGGGTTVTIAGTNFQTGALVLFGTASASTVTVNSATQIQAVTPTNAAGAVDVTVEDAGGQSAKLSGGFTYVGSTSNGRYDGTVKVSGNKFVNGSGEILKLAGVNYIAFDFSGFGEPCVFQNSGDGTVAAQPALMATWKVNIVRIALDEDCWLGINRASGGGAAYQSALSAFVASLHTNNMYAVFALFGVAPGTHLSYGYPVHQLPDSDHSPTFWSQVAAAYKNDPGVSFDLYNEPNGLSGTAGWQDWMTGCSGCAYDSKFGVSYDSPGAQALINSIRDAGASTQPILVGSLQWDQDMSNWLQLLPTDSSHSLVASYHIYNTYGCDQSCYSAALGPILNANIPVMTGEIGDLDCSSNFSVSYMNWADQHDVQYMAWDWEIHGGCGQLSLISDTNGTPTSYGTGIKTHYMAINP